MKPEDVDVSVEAFGMKLRNPFSIASGNLATNAATTLAAHEGGFPLVFYKTVCLNPYRTVNVANRFGAWPPGAKGSARVLRENIEGITEYTLEKNLEEFQRIKDERPAGCYLAVSIMHDPDDADGWCELMERTAPYADLFEVNHGCPQDTVERNMGAAVGKSAKLVAQVAEVTTRMCKSTGISVIHKLTPNDCDPRDPGLAALGKLGSGLSAINTIRSIIGINRDTREPMPTVGGKSVPGGLSGAAVKPIALRICFELRAAMNAAGYQTRGLVGIGGIDNGFDAAEFIEVGCLFTQCLSAVWNRPEKYSYVRTMEAELRQYMAQHELPNLAAFRGDALSKMTTHGELVELDGKSRDGLVT